MKYQNNNESPLIKLLESEGMTRNIPREIRSEMPRSMKTGYKRILKRTGRITLTASIGTFIFFLMRRAATWIPATNIVVPLTVATAITAGSITVVKLAAPSVEASLLVRPFQSVTMSDKTVTASTKIFTEKLNSVSENLKSRISTDSHINNVPYIMIGTMEKSGEKVFLTVKIVDSKTSGILYITEAAASSKTELPVVLEKLALELTAVIQKKKDLQAEYK